VGDDADVVYPVWEGMGEMTTSGYSCARCGTWIMESQTHFCAVYTIPSLPQPVVLTRDDVDTILRLLKEIEFHLRTKR
jgi:hypothetical protein